MTKSVHVITGFKGCVSDGGLNLDQVLVTCCKEWKAKLLRKVYIPEVCMHMHLDSDICKVNLSKCGLDCMSLLQTSCTKTSPGGSCYL